MNHNTNRLLLKELTSEDHKKLDSLVGGFSDPPAYERYLKSMALFRNSVERSLASFNSANELNGWRPTLIAHHVESDLWDLGHFSPEALKAFPVPSDQESLLGVLYVLEGSSLGARLLLRRASALGYSAEYGARHLAAQTATPGTWQAFVSLLDRNKWADPTKAVTSARLTFQIAIEAFS